MAYISPALKHQGALSEVLLRLVPKQEDTKSDMDWRVKKLLQAINRRVGSVEGSLGQICRELKLDISSGYAARLFKRYTGMGAREYAKRKRLSIAAELLTTTDLPVKVIAAELGYRKPVDFSRRFKCHFRMNPSQFRRKSA